MSNPFQVQTRPITKRPAPMSARRSSGWISPWISALTAAAAFLLLIWFFRQATWMPSPVRNIFPLPESGNRIFVAQADLSHEKAQALYRQALSDLEDGSYEKALEEFKRLEPVYPGLQDILWLHEAECYVGQGNEWAVQKKLNSLLQQYPDSAVKVLARYKIGQSQYRGSEWEKAQKTFEKIRQDYPQSDYAKGSLYYLGALLAKEESTQKQAIQPLEGYLRECPDCKFSGDAADVLEKVLPTPTAEEYGLMGVANAAAAKDIKKTLAHLGKGPRAMTWLALGKSQIRAGQTQAGIQTLASGLPNAKDTETAKTAIDAILAHTAPAQQLTLLKGLTYKRLNVGGDYVLWKLAETDPTQAQTYYGQLARDYPQSDYAPESGWRLIWPLVPGGERTSYVAQAQRYLAKYPYARSAPKALFWIAKIIEKSSPAEATRAYQRILEQYPGSYYAFRAKGRLQVLAEGKPDPGWPTLGNRHDYPPEATDFSQLNILPPVTGFAPGAMGWTLRNQAQELQAIGAAEDVRLLVSESLGSLPPAVDSWATQVAGDRAKGLRIIRDALDQQTKDAFLANGGKALQPAGTPDELKLLYPVYFSQDVGPAGRRNQIDPYLIQSLMREESYFNEFAISGSNARGLMQLLPSTAKDVAGWEGMPHFQTSDLFLPDVNVRLGSRYLAHLHDLFNGNAMPAVGAYNGGPGAMKRWVQASAYFSNDPDMFVELIPYEQSRDYIKKVFASYWNYTRLYSHPTL